MTDVVSERAPAAARTGWASRARELPGQAGLPGPLGASPLGEGRCRFVVWAPGAERLELVLPGRGGRTERLESGPRGYWAADVDGVEPGERYLLRIDGERDRPDPASRLQPEGVHGPSAVVDAAEFRWTDGGWEGVPLADHVLYELHVGTFTPEGTLDAAVERLDGLAELGVTTVELMPVAEFPGDRNWGYDGAYPFSVHHAYGGPAGLAGFVDAAHARGLAVCLDVVYNHFGPEGAYQHEFAPYFTRRYATPWGRALNFDGADSDEVRRYFVESALWFVSELHVDALRLDAVDTILDTSPTPFLAELGEALHDLGEEAGRPVHLFAEDDRNDPSLVRPRPSGVGLDAEWNDDFHHAIHSLLTGERGGYYRDFGEAEDLAKGMRDGFVYEGRYSVHRRRRQGSPAADVPARRFVVFSQNHDQVGNRARPLRLKELVGPGAARLAAAAVILSPYTPLLFMGEEYGDPAPFPFFTSHGDPEVVEAVREGRKREFEAFRWGVEPPDPQAEETFRRAVLDHSLAEAGEGRALRGYYRRLLRLRREVPALARSGKEGTDAWAEGPALVVAHRRAGGSEALVLLHASPEPRRREVELPPGRWDRRLDAGDPRWGGSGPGAPDRLEGGRADAVELSAWAAALYTRAD